jgi:formylglycine-generating enzyme required for sulfatase activity
MHGNVWEWCRDWYTHTLPGGTDPEVVSRGSSRVIRGGCWNFDAKFYRSAVRYWKSPDVRDYYLGFRVALSPCSR